MFKYVWIIMLVIAAVIFIGYTIYAIYDSCCEAIETATRTEMDPDIMWLLSETLDNFHWNHNTLCTWWIAIFLATIILTFYLSVVAFGCSKAGG